MRVTDKAEHALAVIGRLSADQIADFFKFEGIKGFPITAGQCPIANYLNRELGGRHSICRDSFFASYDDIGSDYSTSIPDSVAHFIQKFDMYFYPELIKER